MGETLARGGRREGGRRGSKGSDGKEEGKEREEGERQSQGEEQREKRGKQKGHLTPRNRLLPAAKSSPGLCPLPGAHRGREAAFADTERREDTAAGAATAERRVAAILSFVDSKIKGGLRQKKRVSGEQA